MKKHQATFQIEPDMEVWLHGHKKIITHILDFDEVLLTDPETRQPTTAKVSDLKFFKEEEQSTLPDMATIPEKDWELAEKRFEIIEPLLSKPGRKRNDVEKRAKEFGNHTNTVYGWIKLYENTGRVSSLLPQRRSDRGSKKLEKEVELIIRQVIKTEYLTKQKKPVKEVWKEIRKICKTAKLDVPHINTVRKRIDDITVEKKTALRKGQSTADKTSKPIEGNFPGADWPLAVVQIDHTPVDLELVDDEFREPVGRPWITVAIDVFSRMIVGFYISFDPPCSMSVGLCIAHSVLPKDGWLASRDVGGEWPCWGSPTKIHADNAREFRGKMLRRACRDYEMDLEWRPVKQPRYGAHIERLIGTSMNEVHNLPGTTRSNPRDKGEYDSEGHAIMTLSEFEAWYAQYVVNEYHMGKHSALGMPPIAMYRKGIFGGDKKPGVGLPGRILDEQRLRLDLMPFEERSVQNYGVVIDKVFYYHDVLRRWINALDPKSKKLKRKFTFRMDPRDISVIWFYDPELNLYFPIPYRNTSHPPISVWELRQARKALEDEGCKLIDEDALFESHERRREMERKAMGKTKAVRRAQQRRKHVEGTVVEPSMPEVNLPDPEVVEEDIVAPFDEMDDMLS